MKLSWSGSRFLDRTRPPQREIAAPFVVVVAIGGVAVLCGQPCGASPTSRHFRNRPASIRRGGRNVAAGRRRASALSCFAGSQTLPLHRSSAPTGTSTGEGVIKQMKLSVLANCNGCPARSPRTRQGRETGSSRPWPVATSVVRGAYVVRSVNVLSLGSSSGVVGRVPIAPRGGHRRHLAPMRILRCADTPKQVRQLS